MRGQRSDRAMGIDPLVFGDLSAYYDSSHSGSDLLLSKMWAFTQRSRLAIMRV